ncbi:MAG: glycine oxidase ThiO [Deltaproteobacteria bacterium]|nr:MAG: glycine oxidase ThiO [Deltaproteobacteria bacterium]
MTQRIHIAGGGIMGMGAAWRLASAGLEVVVHDPAGPGQETSRASAGMLAPRAEVRHDEEDLLVFGARSQAMWPDWVARLREETGIDCDLRSPGTLVLAADEDERRGIEHHLRWLERIDVPFDALDGDDIRRLEPDLSHHVLSGALIHGDGQVDNRAFLHALHVRLQSLGVTLLSASRITRVVADGGRVTAVETADGERHDTDAALIAAGAWSRQVRIDGLPPLPVRPVRGQLLAFGAADRHGQRTTLRHAIHTPNVYLAQKGDGTILAGATMEERGFERETNTGALYLHLRETRRLIPQVDELPLEEIRIGFRPTTRDNRPLLGETPVRGAWCLTGHFRNGIQQAPASVDAVVDLILGRTPPADTLPFCPSRFLNR